MLKKSFEFRLLDASGTAFYFVDAVDFLVKAGPFADLIEKGFRRAEHVFDERICRWVRVKTETALYVLTNAYGEPVDPDEIFAQGRRDSAARRRLAREAFIAANPRKMHGRRYGRYGYFRNPVTQKSRRQSAAWLPEEYEPMPRQSVASQPTNWSDLHRPLEDNWKRFRKTQWKG